MKIEKIIKSFIDFSENVVKGMANIMNNMGEKYDKYKREEPERLERKLEVERLKLERAKVKAEMRNLKGQNRKETIDLMGETKKKKEPIRFM